MASSVPDEALNLISTFLLMKMSVLLDNIIYNYCIDKIRLILIKEDQGKALSMTRASVDRKLISREQNVLQTNTYCISCSIRKVQISID